MRPRSMVSLTTATALVLDEIDGRWESVSAKQGKCGGGADTEVWESLSLQSQPDGSLEGEFIVRSTDPGCASNRPVTFTRTGDVDEGVSVVDPTTVPARVASGPRRCAAAIRRSTPTKTAIAARM